MMSKATTIRNKFFTTMSREADGRKGTPPPSGHQARGKSARQKRRAAEAALRRKMKKAGKAGKEG